MISAGLLAMVATAMPPPSHARLTNEATTQVAGRDFPIVLTSTQHRKHELDIPAGPLASALVALGEQAGIKVAANATLIAGRTTPRIKGRYTAEAALRQLATASRLKFKRVSSIGFAIVAPPVRTAQAQSGTTNDATSEINLEGIVIKGELIDRDVQDSQTSVVIVTGEELDERGETELGQTLERVPGVSTVNGLVIRGITEDGGLGNSTTASTISLTADGVRFTDYRNTSLTNLSTWDLEQVEVFRGSQSTQSGRNALAGAIVLESTAPKFVPEYKIRGGLTEEDGYLGSFVLNTPVVEDKIAVRLSADKRKGDEGSDDLQTIRAGLLYEPTNRLSFGITYTDIDNFIDNGDEGFSELNLQSPRLTAEYEINDALTFSSRTQHTEAEPTLSLSGIFFGAPVSLLRDREYETMDQEFRLSYKTDRVRAIGGLFYTNIGENSLTDGSSFAGRLLSIEDIETENYAVFGEIEYDLTPQWTLIAGVRYDVEEVKNTTTASAFLPGGALLGSNAGTFASTYDAFLPKLGIVYNFDESRSLGVTYQRGYRAGGVGVNVDAFGAPTTFEFDPEFTDTFELAFRSQSSDGNRTFNANVFYTKWTDQQVTVDDSLGIPIVSNAASSELWGAEVDYRQVVTENLEVFASAALLKTKYDDYVREGVQLSGNEFPFAPNLKASFGANYTFANGLTIGGDVNYNGSTFSDASNTPGFQNDSYWLTNVNANYTFENGAVLTAYARNLFDVEYTTQQTVSGFVGIGPEREYGVHVKVDF